MTKTIHPLLSHYSSTKWGGGKGVLIRGGGTYFKFWPIEGTLIQRGHLFEAGANSRIYGKQ